MIPIPTICVTRYYDGFNCNGQTVSVLILQKERPLPYQWPVRVDLLYKLYKLTCHVYHVKTQIIIFSTCETFVQKSNQPNRWTGCKHFYIKYNHKIQVIIAIKTKWYNDVVAAWAFWEAMRIIVLWYVNVRWWNNAYFIYSLVLHLQCFP